jgi:hypothetical protein
MATGAVVSILVAASITLASAGAFGIFTQQSVSSVAVGAGTVTLSWNQARLTQLATTIGPLDPGDSVQMVADLGNSGVTDLRAIQIAVTGTDTGTLSDGLQLAIDSCSVPWVGSAGTMACTGVTTVVSVDRPVVGLINLPGSSALAAGGTDHLRFTYRLSEGAPTSMANSSGVVSLIATGIQRAGQLK